MNNKLQQAKVNMVSKEKFLSNYACCSKKAVLLKDDKEDIRPTFFRDIDRIIHSLAYTRYIDKTQVYPFTRNDHITHRVLHVQLVSKIARTIGRSLELNEDLIEAIALGHDVGHAPFGHKGEKYLILYLLLKYLLFESCYLLIHLLFLLANLLFLLYLFL